MAAWLNERGAKARDQQIETDFSEGSALETVRRVDKLGAGSRFSPLPSTGHNTMLFDSEMPTPPEPDASDYAQSVAKLGLAFVAVHYPHLAPLLLAWDQFSGVVFNRRIAGFFQSVMGDLQQRVKSPEALFQNEQFISALLQTMQAAARSHQSEKLEVLRNAVVNVALGKEPDDDRQAIFISLAERFTPLHLGLLRFFKNPLAYCEQKGKNPPPERDNQPVFLLVFDCMEEFAERTKSPYGDDRPGSRSQLIDVVVTELEAAALITPELKNAYQKPPRYSGWTTHLGDDFLDFITADK